jgi:hypothetical protein
MKTRRKKNWYENAKLKDPSYSTVATQLVVQKLPEGLIPRVREYCQNNGIYIRRFVTESLELGLEERLGARK